MPGILIVEDEVIVGYQLEFALTRGGYTVCARVNNAERAIRAAQQLEPCLVLMDIGLPGEMSGLDAARQIRCFSKVPILFVTGYEDEAMRQQAYTFQPARYMIKPVRVQQLKPLIDEFLRIVQ